MIQRVTIREVGARWLNKHTGRYYGSAVTAQRAVKRDAKRLAKTAGIVVSIIDWETTTQIGTRVVKAISGTTGTMKVLNT
jgi:hypothetical protein